MNVWVWKWVISNYKDHDQQIQHVHLTSTENERSKELQMTTKHVLWSDSASDSTIFSLLFSICCTSRRSQSLSHLLFILCKVSELWQSNLLSTHWSEHFLFCQESQRHLSHLRICIFKYWISQWLHRASNEYASTSWCIIKQCTAKIEDKEQEDVEWIHSQNYL